MEFPTPTTALLHMTEPPALALDADVAEIANWAAAEAPGGAARTDSDSSSHEGAGKPQRRRKRPKSRSTEDGGASDGEPKPRKPTYLVRKEEKESLQDEIKLLEARLELLKVRAGMPSGEDKRTLASVQESNFELEEAIHTNLLGVARFHSLLARHMHSIPVNPMKTFIHLSKDIPERRATLRAMREMKLRRAQELTSDRMKFIDPTKPYSTEERFVSEDGKYHCKRFELLPFEGLRDAKQVFDALLYYMTNMEISVTEMLGQLTVREDMDTIDPNMWNHRIVTATGNGYFQEHNTVGFAQFFDAYEPHGGAQHGVIASDSVDVDDLYPYMPRERVRKDVTAALTVSELRKPGTNELVVVLKRCMFMSIHTPQFPLPTAVMDDMRANITAWCAVMAKFLRDSLVPGGSLGPAVASS